MLSPFCHSIRQGGIFYAKGVESTRPVVVYYGKYPENIQYKRGSIYVSVSYTHLTLPTILRV